MKLHHLHRRQSLPISIDTAWDFFSSPMNLTTITPPWLGLQITSQPPPAIHNGLIVTYRVRPLWGLPTTWITEIAHVEPPVSFVDEQRLGPYRFWHHRHIFNQIPGGVEMTDSVHYVMPMGIIGDLFHRFLIEKKLAAIFDFRRNTLERLFGTIEA